MPSKSGVAVRAAAAQRRAAEVRAAAARAAAARAAQRVADARAVAARAAASRAAAARGAKSAAAVRVAAAAKAKAARAAVDQRSAKLVEIEKARHVAYEELRTRQSEILRQTGIIRPPAKPPAPLGPKRPGLQRPAPTPVPLDRKRAGRVPVPVERPAPPSPYSSNIHDEQRSRTAFGKYQARVAKAKTDPKTGTKELESVLVEMSKRSGGGSVDVEAIGKITEKYISQTKDVAAKYKVMEEKIIAYLDKGNVKAARTLYYGKEFRALSAEFTRLNGTGKDPGKDGSIAAFGRAYESIKQANEDWWKRQVGAALGADRANIADRLRRARALGETDMVKQLTEMNKIYQGSTGKVVDHYVPSGDGGPPNPVYRQRTVSEELDYRDSLKRIEMGRLRAQYDVQQASRTATMRAEGLVYGVGGQMLSRDEKAVEDDALRLVADKYGGEKPTLKSSEDLMKFSDALVSDWEVRHPKPTSTFVGRHPTDEYSAWKALRDAYEKRVYAYSGGGTPAVWDRLFALPGISHALATLQAGSSLVGVAARVPAKIVTGSSQLNADLGLVDAPPEIQQKFANLAGAGQLPGTFNGKQRAAFAAWKKTPEGVAWFAGKQQVQWAKAQSQDEAFASGVYGNTTIGEKVAALNAYGSQPTNRDVLNLGFQILSDPTLAMPLKFTTYAARAHYAAEMGAASKFLGSSKLGAVRDFTKVDEGFLRMRKELDFVETRLKDGGTTLRQLIDEISAEVAGVAKKSERDLVIEGRLRAVGFTKRELSETQLFNFIEESVTTKLKREKIPYESQADLEKRIVAATAAEKKVGVDARMVTQAKREAARQADAAARLPAARKSRAALNKARLAEEKAAAPTPVKVVVPESIGPRLKKALPGRTESHFPKDVAKASDSNKFIGVGARSSSTDVYMKALGGSDTAFKSTDTVFVSANGKRPGRVAVTDANGALTPTYGALDLAVSAKATIVTDILVDRVRPFNVGEREVASYLERHGYVEASPGRWKPRAAAAEPRVIAEHLGQVQPAVDAWSGRVIHAAEQADPADFDRLGLLAHEETIRASLAKAEANVPNVVERPNARGTWGRAIARMTEEQFWDHLTDQARAVRRDKRSTPAMKAAARKTLSDIEGARFAKAASKGKRYVSPKQRREAVNSVNSLHGKDAEELVRDNIVAPYVEDAQAVAVEQTRSYRRTLRSVTSGDVKSNITSAGPAFKEDYFPFELWNKVETEVADGLFELRGKRNQLLVAKRKGFKEGLDDLGDPAEAPEPKVSRMEDTDPDVVALKREILGRHGVTITAYDEARKVLRKGYLASKNANRLMRDARALSAKGEDYAVAFKRLRNQEARAEGRRQLGILAGDEMYGHTPDEVMAEFVSRWTDDGMLRDFEMNLSAFQRRTLEEHMKSLSGVADLSDEPAMSAWLMSRNAPPMHSRELMRDHQVDIGAWSPRRAKQFTTGAVSWSDVQESKYMDDSYGQIPDWANHEKLAGEFNPIFHDQALYGDQHQAWGIFNRSAELKLRLSGKTAEEIQQRVFFGDEVLGLKGKREWALQRKYVIERNGEIVGSIDPDGTTHLVSMPWLMSKDEARAYFVKRQGIGIAPDLAQSAEEVAQIEKIIDKAIDETGFWDKYIAPSAADGPVAYEDVFRLSSAIQARLLADPKWARRTRDLVGDSLDVWSTAVRASVFTNWSFAVANIVDSPIKTAWYRYTNRMLLRPGPLGTSAEGIRRGSALVPQSLGVDVQTTLYEQATRPVADYLLHPKHTGLLGALERATVVPRGMYRLPPALAGKVEIAAKMNIARDMFPVVFDEALARLGDADLADAFTRRFVKKEINRMWPTVGDGPLEKFYNRFVPFATYSVRNKILFISEAAAHPSILNQIDYVGRYVEEQNRKEQERRHPGVPMDPHMARRIELPWAPGYFIDLGQFTDATRGLKPLYQTRPQSYLEFASSWVRVVGANTMAGVLMLTNALGVTQRVQWKPIFDEAGYVTGYERVVSGWTEPWSQDQPGFSSFVPLLEAIESAQKLGSGDWTLGEISVLVGKAFMYGAVEEADRGGPLFEFYKSLKEKNKAVAESWLTSTPDGRFLSDWMASKMGSVRDVADWLDVGTRQEKDKKRWFHTQSAAFQKAVGQGYDRINAIRDSYKLKLEAMDPQSNEFKQTKAEMYFFVSEVYRLTPELMVSEVYNMTPSEWGRKLQTWQKDMKIDEFMQLNDLRPKRENFKDGVSYRKALEVWTHQKEIFLKTYPEVEASLGQTRNAFDRAREEQEAEWNTVLDRIGVRGEMIDAALAKDDRERADQLYLANELDFNLLERDRIAMYWNESDFNELPRGKSGPPTLRDKAMKTVKVLFDFDAVRLEKAKREGTTQKFYDDLFYANGIQEVIAKAKGGDKFGKFDPGVFLAELKKRPRLLGLYFAKHPGKEAQWKKSDQYMRFIGPWGKAAGAKNWDAAERIWAGLPQWVKDRYFANNPESRYGKQGSFSKKSSIATSNYMGWMQRWVKTFDSADKGAGMKFFWSMPKDVRERYFSKHPDKRVKWEAQLKFGAQLGEYFAADKAAQPGYLAAHPDLAKWLAKNVSTKASTNWGIQSGYAAIPSSEAWLRRIYREKYPEVFGKKELGEQRLRRTFDKLAVHPEFTDDFERWRDAIWKSYTEMLRNDQRGRPKGLTSERAKRRRGGGLSAAQTSA